MKTLNAYILKNLLFTAMMAFAILTFGMFSGYFFKAMELLYRGISPLMMCKFLLYMVPEILRFTLPLSLLTATVLVFGHLSSDNEIVAMKAVGISIWQIISPALIISFALSIICLLNALFISPLLRQKSDSLQKEALVSSPVALLEPGIFTNFSNDNWAIRVGRIHGNRLEDIHILQRNNDGDAFQDIYAKSGRMTVISGDEVELELNEMNLTSTKLKEKPLPSNVHYFAASKVTIPLDLKKQNRSTRRLVRKSKYMDVRMLFARMAQEKSAGHDVTKYMVDLHTRLALAVSPFSFLLIGLPFAIRGKRSELSVGLLMCVLLALGFYFFMMLGDLLEDIRFIHAEFILWIPNIIYQVVGICLIRRMDRNQ